MAVSHKFIKGLLEFTLSSEYVSDDLAVCEAYSKDAILRSILRKHRKDQSSQPEFVVLPGSTEEVSNVLQIADKYGYKIIPISTGVNMTGLCIPLEPNSIALDLKRMNKIIEINEEDSTATIQPYVSFARLQAETMKKGLWNGGTPLAPASNAIISNIMFSGGATWQSALAYGYGPRSIVNLKIVFPNGDILNTGSSALNESGNFWWSGPGPDIKGIFEWGHCGEFGVVTEATIKLYPWVGGDWSQEEVYDRPRLPARHKIFFIEYPNFESMIKAIYEIAHSGIGTHLNAIADSFNAFFTQPTRELTEMKFKENYFPKHLLYVIIAGISSDKQLVYEEKVLKEIVEETRGKFLFDDFAEEMSTWNADAFRAGDTTRMCRLGSYAGVRMGFAPIKYRDKYYQSHVDIINKRSHYMLDEEMPFTYIFDRGYFCLHETDTYYDQSDLKMVEFSRENAKDGFIADAVGLKPSLAGLGWMFFVEPLTSILGSKVGPRFNLLLEKLKDVFDPNRTMNPGKLIKS